jgi:preprotein translocase subunit YajC
MRLILGSFIALGVALAVGSPAAAQSVGMQVVDASGAPVGTVTAIQGSNIMVKTDRHEALLPKASFTVNNGKLLFGMTQAQLNSKIEEATAASQKAIAVGATVKGLQGTEIGKIDSVSDSGVVIALSSGKKIQVQPSGVRGNPDGTVTVGLTAEQINAVNASAPAAGTTAQPAGTPQPSSGK